MAALFFKGERGESVRKLVWFTIGFAAACFVGAVAYGDWLLPAAGAAFLACGILVLLQRKGEIWRRPVALVLGLSLGLCWFGFYDLFFVMLPRAADDQTLPVTIEASDYSYETAYGCAVEGYVRLNDREYRVKAYLNEKTEISPGDRISGSFLFRVTTDGGSRNPTNHRTEGIFLLAYARGEMSASQAEEMPRRYLPAKWRKKLLDRISYLFPEAASGFAAALLLGDRTGIDYETETAFKVSGISHVVAVSGLHVSILFGFLYTLVGRKRVLACLLGIPSMFLFAAMVGFTPSITRACIMQSLVLIALVFDREYDPGTALAFAALVMLCFNPLVILSVSFQLSAGCMIGIILFSERIRTWIMSRLRIAKGKRLRDKLKRWFASSVSITLGATAVTTPLVAWYFGCVSLVGVLTNLLTLWVISFVFYGILFALLFSLFSNVLALITAWGVSLPILYVLETAKLLSSLPMAAVYTVNPINVAWLVGVYGMLVIFLLQREKKPAILFICVGLTFCLSQVFCWSEPLLDECRVTVLDVGQGQSVLLQAKGKTFLVDCGSEQGESAADVAAETLLSQGISRLDGIIVTHFDADHTCGLPGLLSRVKADRLLLPYVEDTDGVGKNLAARTDGVVQYVREDQVLTFDGGRITVFGPNSYEADNENSLCILFQTENCDILITGDRGEMGELLLVHEYELPKLEVLIVGHHGSGYSTMPALLEETQPEIGIISAGKNNRYGHPSPKVLQRLQNIGCLIFRTDLQGTIIYRR